MEEALHEISLLRDFAGLDDGEDAMLDETTIVNFRRLLLTHGLAQSLFDETAAQLAEQALLLRRGTIVEARLVADGGMTDALIHGEERIVLGDRAYTRTDRNLEAEHSEEQPVWGMPFKRKKSENLPAEHAVLNRMLASLRVKVEHPFRIVKRHSAIPRCVTGGCSRTPNS